MQKAFDIIDHDILLNKLRNLGCGVSEINWFASYLKQRHQYVLSNGVHSDLQVLTRGVPQGSVLGPSLFCLYFNSIVDTLDESLSTLYADDTEIHCSNSSFTIAQDTVNNQLVQIDRWLNQNKMIANTKKTKAMTIASRPALKKVSGLQLFLNNKSIEEVTTFNYLGLRINNFLSWNDQVSTLCQRIYPKLQFLNRVSAFLPKHITLRIYKQTILPILDYCCIVWHDCGSTLSKRVEKLQNRAMRIILHKDRGTCSQDMRNELNILSLFNRRRFLRFLLVFKIVYNVDCPSQLKNTLIFRSSLRERSLRDKSLLDIPKLSTSLGQTTFKFAAAKDWNSLPKSIRELSSYTIFKNVIYTYLQGDDIDSHICSL